MSLTRAICATIVGCSLLFWACPRPASAQDDPPQTQAGRRDKPAGRGQPGDQPSQSDNRPEPPWRGRQPNPGPTEKGLILNSDAAFAGYTLFAPLNSTTTYLIDMKCEITHSWPSQYEPGQAAYLLDYGSLLRCSREPGNRHFRGGGIGGRVERIAPDGMVLWEFVYADEKHCLHHDIEPLPNGNVLMIAWEKKTRRDAIAAGRDPSQLRGKEVWPDCIIEVEPKGARGGRIVWEWHVWDHLVQSLDKNKPNYGVVAEHPELVDLNFSPSMPPAPPAEIQRLRALGYVGGAPAENEDRDGPPHRGPGGFDMQADWCHTNAIAYDAKLDQIALSVHNFNEIWIIDHGTTTQEAAGHAGGRYGKGGDLLYRWGNPSAFGAGDANDQQLFAQHDARWIPEGAPGAGHLMVFNNGMGRPDGRYSSVVEIAPPINASGGYTREPGRAFGPAKPCWQYVAANKEAFFSPSISGAERLANGDTLVCSGEQGRIFEVTGDGKIVWEYVNPYIENRRPQNDGGDARGAPPRSQQRPFPPAGGPGGPWGPPPGGGPMGGLFRAARLAPDHPGVRHLLDASPAQQHGH
jgi:hypothetical protein